MHYSTNYLLLLLNICITLTFFTPMSGASQVGLNWGLLGNNLPAPYQVVSLLIARQISKVRLFEPNPNVLRALQKTNIEIMVGTTNQDVQNIANDPAAATAWVSSNILPYLPGANFKYVVAGNEVIPGSSDSYVLNAMQNLDAALKAANVNVPVSTTISLSSLGTSFPPSAGDFSENSKPIMEPISNFFSLKGYPLLLNGYSYFPYIRSSPGDIRLDYALGTAQDVVVTDGAYQYKRLIDAMIDAMYAAMEKVGVNNVRIVLSESGWPNAGDTVSTVDNAKTYVNNLVSQAASGTPRRPDTPQEIYIFSLFNENLKPPGVEQNWGIYYPDLTEIYHVEF